MATCQLRRHCYHVKGKNIVSWGWCLRKNHQKNNSGESPYQWRLILRGAWKCLENHITICQTDFHNAGEEFTFRPSRVQTVSSSGEHELSLKCHISHVKGKKMCAQGKVRKYLNQASSSGEHEFAQRIETLLQWPVIEYREEMSSSVCPADVEIITSWWKSDQCVLTFLWKSRPTRNSVCVHGNWSQTKSSVKAWRLNVSLGSVTGSSGSAASSAFFISWSHRMLLL